MLALRDDFAEFFHDCCVGYVLAIPGQKNVDAMN